VPSPRPILNRRIARRGRPLVRAARVTTATYTRSDCGQHSAAISYHVFFSLVPFVALILAVLEAVLPETSTERVVSWLVGVLPLSGELSGVVVDAVEESAPPASATGVIAAAGLLWAASGMMASVRKAFRSVWESEARRPFLRGKALDLVLVLGSGLLVVGAFALSVVVQLVTDTSTRVVSELGGSGSAAARLGPLGQVAGTTALTCLAFLLLYRFVPPVATRLRDALPAAALAAVAVQVVAAGFSIYLERFADFDRVYGPLGAVFALLLLVNVVSTILLFGACLTAAAGQRRTLGREG
jgi:membrane protein